MQSLEHIDPRDSKFICGLENQYNEIWVDESYNARKTNRFVPYRVNGYPAPMTFGDIGEFLINLEWVVCEFGGETWWEESNRLGNSCIHGGKTQGRRAVESRVGLFSPEYQNSLKLIEDRRKIGLRRFSEKTGIFDPDYINSDKYREDKSKAGKAASSESKAAAGRSGGASTAKLISKPIVVIFPDGSEEVYSSSVEAANKLGLNGLTLRRLASSGKPGVRQPYRGLRVKNI